MWKKSKIFIKTLKSFWTVRSWNYSIFSHHFSPRNENRCTGIADPRIARLIGSSSGVLSSDPGEPRAPPAAPPLLAGIPIGKPRWWAAAALLLPPPRCLCDWLEEPPVLAPGAAAAAPLLWWTWCWWWWWWWPWPNCNPSAAEDPVAGPRPPPLPPWGPETVAVDPAVPPGAVVVAVLCLPPIGRPVDGLSAAGQPMDDTLSSVYGEKRLSTNNNNRPLDKTTKSPSSSAIFVVFRPWRHFWPITIDLAHAKTPGQTLLKF